MLLDLGGGGVAVEEERPVAEVVAEVVVSSPALACALGEDRQTWRSPRMRM